MIDEAHKILRETASSQAASCEAMGEAAKQSAARVAEAGDETTKQLELRYYIPPLYRCNFQATLMK